MSLSMPGHSVTPQLCAVLLATSGNAETDLCTSAVAGKTISYEESIQIKTGIPDVFQVKTGATFDQEYSYSNEFDTAQSVTDTVEEDFAVKQNIDVPPETTVRADWMLAQAGGVQVCLYMWHLQEIIEMCAGLLTYKPCMTDDRSI